VGPVISRRELLRTMGAAWFAEQVLPDRGHISGRIVGASHAIGHKLREPLPTMPTAPSEHADVVVIGSGISGLSAAWRLAKAGVTPTVLELEPLVGGTSSWGDDGVVPHPWGAHYLPVPERGARSVTRLLTELGVITDWDPAGQPRFDNTMLCHAPEERLHFRDRWHGGLVPYESLTSSERAEIDRFRAKMHELSRARGSDGRDAFAIPAALSSRDPTYRSLDDITMAAWLTREGYGTAFLRWFAQYGTLDDFGAELDQVSAWAGIHYYAARKLETEQLEGSRYLVWPEGNGWLARQLVARLPRPIQTGALALSVRPTRSGVEVDYYCTRRQAARRVRAKAAICAVPAFIARRLLGRGEFPQRTSSPWVVANLHVRQPIDPNRAWDSVIYDSPSLGYVDAGHQRIAPAEQTVLTYFRAYGEPNPAATRSMLLDKSWGVLAAEILSDLSVVHPALTSQTQRIDVMVWGHAMPRPKPGFLRASTMHATPLVDDRIGWAHVDQTGFALFEEANYRGVRAAEAICDVIDADTGDSYL